jgi:hypothetical protein
MEATSTDPKRCRSKRCGRRSKSWCRSLITWQHKILENILRRSFSMGATLCVIPAVQTFLLMPQLQKQESDQNGESSSRYEGQQERSWAVTHLLAERRSSKRISSWCCTESICLGLRLPKLTYVICKQSIQNSLTPHYRLGRKVCSPNPAGWPNMFIGTIDEC